MLCIKIGPISKRGLAMPLETSVAVPAYIGLTNNVNSAPVSAEKCAALRIVDIRANRRATRRELNDTFKVFYIVCSLVVLAMSLVAIGTSPKISTNQKASDNTLVPMCHCSKCSCAAKK